MLLFQQAFFWLSAATLYVGFGAVMGSLLRRSFSKPPRHPYPQLAIAHGLLFFLPTSILLLGHADWAIFGRIGLLSIGCIATILSIIQPGWIPSMVWRRASSHRYFTITLALVVLWGISTIVETRTLSPVLISISACLVGFVSWQTAVRSA
jgi:hypothetical protein